MAIEIIGVRAGVVWWGQYTGVARQHTVAAYKIEIYLKNIDVKEISNKKNIKNY